MNLIKLFLIAIKETLAIFIPCLRKPINYSAVEKKVLVNESESGSKLYVYPASPCGDYPDVDLVILDKAEDDEIV